MGKLTLYFLIVFFLLQGCQWAEDADWMEEEGLPISIEDLVENGASDLVGVVEKIAVRERGPMSTQAMRMTVITKLITNDGKEYSLFVRPDAKFVDMQVSGRDAVGNIHLWEPGRRYRVLGFPMELTSGIHFIVVRARPDSS